MSIKKALLLCPERLTQKDLYLFYRYARLLLVELSQLAVRSENLFDLVLVEPVRSTYAGRTHPVSQRIPYVQLL